MEMSSRFAAKTLSRADRRTLRPPWGGSSSSDGY